MRLSGDAMMHALKNDHERGDAKHNHESPPGILSETHLDKVLVCALR